MKFFNKVKVVIAGITILALIAASAAPAFADGEQEVKEGVYVLYSGVGNNMVLDVKGASNADKANVQIYKANGTQAQQFRIQKSGRFFKITNIKSGKVVDVSGGSKNNAANVWQYKWNGTAAQLWNLVSAGGGYYYLVNVGSGKVLDVKGAKSANATNVWQYTANYTKAQKWKLKLIKDESPKKAATSTKNNTATSSTQTAKSDSIKTESSMSTKTNTGSAAQTTSKSAEIKTGLYVINSGVGGGMVLDVKGGSEEPNANVQIYKNNGTNAQVFFIQKTNGHYKIVNLKSGYAIDVSGQSKANTANIRQYWWEGWTSQLWDFIPAGSGAYRIVNVSSGKAMEVSGGKAVDSANVHQNAIKGSTAQIWTLKNYKRVMVGSARQSETGSIDGVVGDQWQYFTPDYAGEVGIEPYYDSSMGWICLRAKNPEVRKKLVYAMTALCNNGKVGYSQYKRLKAYDELEKVDFDPAKLKVNVGIDCSEAVRVCLGYAGIETPDFYTATEASIILKTKQFTQVNNVNVKTVLPGDILVTKKKGHTVIVLG